MFSTLLCDRCGYDLRATPDDGKCPECELVVEESRRLAAIPYRPAWRDSDPRWRRRMLAGAWILAFIPLVALLETTGLAGRIFVPAIYDSQNPLQTLDGALVSWLYAYLMFFTGVVLLFARERFRRRNRLDWTRRWGVITCYAVAFLGIPFFAFVSALVLVGIAAMFFSLPAENQPAVTGLFVEVGAGYIFYGLQASETSDLVLIATSSLVILLACIPLFDAMRSSGPRVLAAILLAPLALSAVLQITGAAMFHLGIPGAGWFPISYFYFDPVGMVSGFADLESLISRGTFISARFLLETAKWLAILSIALWLSIAQVSSWRQGNPKPHDGVT